jgi:uncharacterized protein
MRVGLISDTHGLVRAGVFECLSGVELILHAGDVGAPGILAELETVAPVHAVWGNTDGFDVRAVTRATVDLELAGRRVVVTHGHELGSPTPERLRAAHPDAHVIVYGHTHRPLVEADAGVLVVNPGAAGPARFALPPSVAILVLDENARVDLIELDQ